MTERISARCCGGMTLIEQIAVLAISSVLLVLAIPAFAGLVRHERMREAQMALVGTLRFSRQMAVFRGERVLLCPSRDGRRCSGETRWEHGWLVGIDRNHDRQPDGAPLRTGLYRDGLAIRSSVARRYVAYQPDGTSGGSNIALVLCAPKQPALAVVVSNWGRIRGARPTARQAAVCRRGRH